MLHCQSILGFAISDEITLGHASPPTAGTPRKPGRTHALALRPPRGALLYLLAAGDIDRVTAAVDCHLRHTRLTGPRISLYRFTTGRRAVSRGLAD
jgi:hypothetical protein